MKRWPRESRLTIALIAVLLSALSLETGCDNPTTVPAPTPTSPAFTYQVRVQVGDTGEECIENATVTIEVIGKAPLNVMTDSTGLARVLIPSTHAGQPGTLIVEAAGYKKRWLYVDLIRDALPVVVKLEPVPATSTSVPTPTPAPTTADTPTPTPTATDTPAPAKTPVSTTPSVSLAPVLRAPEDGIHASGNLVFSWTYRSLSNEGPYGGEYFALRVWHEGDEPKSITWTKGTSYEVEFGEHGLGAPGGYFWNVAVVRQTGPDRNHQWELVSSKSESETRGFSVPPPIPTPTPGQPKATNPPPEP